MAEPGNSPRKPSLRLHKASGRAFVEIDKRRIYLGRHGTPEAESAYHRILAEWASNGYTLPVAPESITVFEVCAAYLKHLEARNKSANTLNRTRVALKPVHELYGYEPAASFRPRSLRACRQLWIDAGLSVGTINMYSGMVKRCFKWAATRDMIPDGVHTALCKLEGVRAGEGEGADPVVRGTVPQAHVDAVLPFLPGPLQAVMRLQLLTGARPSELLTLKRGDIDRAVPEDPDVWRAHLTHHKTAWKGKSRWLYFGKQCQEILKPYLLAVQDQEYLFSPRAALRERHKNCPTPRRPNQKPNPVKTPRKMGECYTHVSYNRAVRRACEKAGVPRFCPYALRHTAASHMHATADLKTASLLLSHSSLETTQGYVHADDAVCIAWAREHG